MFCCFESKQKSGESYERLVPVILFVIPQFVFFGRYIFFLCKKNMLFVFQGGFGLSSLSPGSLCQSR